MTRVAPAALLLLACATLAAAQGEGKTAGRSRPDFSGTWRVDKSKSDFGEFSDRPLSKADATLVVEHRDPELKIRRTLGLNGREEVKEFAYYADGRGETNQATIGVGEVRSKTKWDGDRVVSEARVTRRSQTGPYDLDVVQKWQVSSDGKTLTNTTTISNQMGAQQVKMVYRRGQQQ